MANPLREVITGTTHATVGTETTHPHTLGVVPDFVAITEKSNGTVYQSQPADATNVYVKGSATSLDFEALVIKDHTIIK